MSVTSETDRNNVVDLENLGFLKKRRGGLKSRITYFAKLYSQRKIVNTGEIQSTMDRIKEIYKKFDEVQSQLEEASEEPDICEDRFSFEESYGDLEAALINDLRNLENQDKLEFKKVSEDLPAVSGSQKKVSNDILSIKLPEIRLPKFNGQITEWVKFRDLFQDFIHNRNVDPITKFYYLTSAVKEGKAYHVIESIPLKAENYNMAWKELCNHFDNDCEIQKNHMKALYEITRSIENSAVSLQNFIDNLTKHYNALNALGIKVNEWNLFLYHHVLEKLDNASKIYVLENSSTTKIIEFSALKKILQDRVRILESIKNLGNSNSKGNKQFHKESSLQSARSSNHSQSKSSIGQKLQCYYCRENHLLHNCPKFTDIKFLPKDRLEFVKNNHLCINCLSARHRVFDCRAIGCLSCSLKHNTLLHMDRMQINNPTPPNQNSVGSLSVEASNKNSGGSSLHCNKRDQNYGVIHCNSCKTSKHVESNQILLATAVILAESSNSQLAPCRALLDSGSDSNFITKNLCNLLQLLLTKVNIPINGIGANPNFIKYQTWVTIKSRTSNFKKSIKCLVLAKISENLPSISINVPSLEQISKLNLADPTFYRPNAIDFLIGAELFFDIISFGRPTMLRGFPPLYDSAFGLIVSGKVRSNSNVQNKIQNSNCSMAFINVSSSNLSKSIENFWQLEEVNVNNNYSNEDMLVEKHFTENVVRGSEGRYTVKIPLKNNIYELRDSYQSAFQKFLWLERKLDKSPNLKSEYVNFINEYKNLNHMELVRNKLDINSSIGKVYYMPHHHLIRESSTTTKLRVVFNASSKTQNGISLNEAMFSGSVVQQDLASILLRFRKHRVALTGDITKMYRQIWIDPNQRDLLRILWRDSITNEIECYRLTTVTYGTASAPYLATRTLLQLACDETEYYPLASEIVKSDFYVDDLLTGAPTIESANKIKQDIISLLSKDGFELRKLSSNEPGVVPFNNNLESSSNAISILGMKWDVQKDTFCFDFQNIVYHNNFTKRFVLSEIAQLFDPIGLCGPVVFIAKRFMQKLWIHSELSWDDPLPSDLTEYWKTFRTQFLDFKVEIPRCVLLSEPDIIEIHGFGDASDVGYGAAVYSVSRKKDGGSVVNLLCAKSRVAPIKKQTIPRLELCAALLVAKLMHKVLNALNTCVNKIVCWSDSEITLFRINSDPSKYQQFVANRIIQILEFTNSNQWWYVPSNLNPADLLSRGVLPKDLNSTSLWWYGPEFLKCSTSDWPNQKMYSKTNYDETEYNKKSLNVFTNLTVEEWEVFSRFSNLERLISAVALCRRLFNNSKFSNSQKTYGRTSPKELQESETKLIKISQLSSFGSEIKCLQENKQVIKTSKLVSLNPFLDKNGVLRIGGRLQNSGLPFESQHPIILSKSHGFSKLVVRSEHIRLLHAGSQTLLFNIRQRFWIVGGRNLCKRVVHDCIICFKAKPELQGQIMGNLPEHRVSIPQKIFNFTGVDFAGPFLMKHKLRKQVVTKFYIAIFVCFSSKAVHIELVEDLTTQSFIAALIRFMSRRGFCAHIYSDNATNFIGARAEIEWHTIPPKSPHFGGLWEAAVKSAKHLMQKIIGKATYNRDEYHTLFCQIEAILNSRPLIPMSDDPHDLNYLSPSHFITGNILTTLPNPSLEHLDFNKLSRFQRVQHLQQQFWKRWSLDYISGLQQRNKWRKTSPNVKEGALVLLKEDNVPPQMWSLGRITKVFQGNDGLIRVVQIKTQNSEFKRAIHKIAVLPLESDD